jgi:hypothetical protein
MSSPGLHAAASTPDQVIGAAAASAPSAHAAASPPPVRWRHPAAFTRLKWTSFTHSCIYTALLVCAFAAGKPQPATFVLGLSHGLLWIFMSLACLACVRMRIVPLRLAVAVAVLGGIGPFFGSYEFVREQRRRRVLSDDDSARPAHSRTQTPR